MTVSPALKSLLASSNQLFTLPDIFIQLNEMIRDPRFSLVDIGKVIAKDPGLSARLLQLVNSSFYGFQSKIDTISRAVTVVGVDELYNLIVATCVVDRFENIPSELVDMTDFWMRSVHTGVMAKLLAKGSLVLHSERLFLAGLLHDVGSLVLYQNMPNESRRVLQLAGHDRRLVADFELDILGFTHADVARELIKSWGLPESLYEPIGCYLNPEYAHLHRLDAYLLNIATSLVDAGGRGENAEYAAAALSAHALALTRMSREQLLLIIPQAADDFLAVFDMMAPNKRFH
ncbi:HDOD domain-containing protein [Methylomonas sp. AM2-LC]|uniref:HDOD domain-containing protein n=1 Tax=Methylomonas sp. AM2-LC TaxID=3153301 RepID=UPI00326735A5